MPDPSPQPGAGKKPAPDICKSCGQPISARYYRVKGDITCASCTAKINKPAPPDTAAAFLRGLAFGVIGAVLAIVVFVAYYLLSGAVHHWAADLNGGGGATMDVLVTLGDSFLTFFVWLAVGIITGSAIIIGSRDACGLRYQIAGAVLTVVAALVSLGLYQALTTRPASVLALVSSFLDFQTLLWAFAFLVVSVAAAWHMTAVEENYVVGPFTLSDSSASQTSA